MILQGLKARIFDTIEKYGAKWLQELSRVVWGLRTQRSRATGYSLFFMVYGSEAVLPSDIAFGAPRIQNYDENEAEAIRCTDIDSAEEHRLMASIQHARYEQQLRRYHDRCSRARLHRRRPGSMTNPVDHRRSQAVFPMGRPLCSQWDSGSWNLPPTEARRYRCGQPMEY